MTVTAVSWEETEEQVTEEPHPFPVAAFLSHEREQCSATSGVIDTSCARILAGTRSFENFEDELKKHATPVEVVPDNETFRFGPGAVKKSSRAVIFPVAVGQNVFSLRTSLLDEEVPLLISMGVVKQPESVIDVAQKTIEFRNIQNAKVPLEVVAGHLTMDLRPKHASSFQKHLTTQMWDQARHGQEVPFRPSSERHAIHDPSVVHHVVKTATQSKRHVHHDAPTGHVHNAVEENHLNDIGLSPHLAHGVYWRSRAGELLPVRRWRRRTVGALANRMSHAGGFSIMVSGSPDFCARTTRSTVRGVEVPNRQRTSYFGNHEKTPVGRGGSDAAVVVQRQGRTRDGGTAPIGLAGTPTRGGRASARAKETTPTWLEEIPSRRDQGTGNGTDHPNRWAQRLQVKRR